MNSKSTVYEIITERIINRIENEKALPWKQPWKNYLSADGGPQNLVSKKPYRGINVVLLSGGATNYWLSFKQAQQLGGTVRKGEKGTPCIFWLIGKDTDKDTGKEKKSFVLRYYTVFNLSQCDGIKTPEQKEIKNTFEPIALADSIVAGMPKKPAITFKESRAYYSPQFDYVNMPKPESFNSPHNYYSTLFHELGHATGHKSRLDRQQGDTAWNAFGSDPYAKEELVAEMTAAYCCGALGLEMQTEDQHVAYLDSWISRLKRDSKLLIHAASQAQKATDYIFGQTKNDESEKE